MRYSVLGATEVWDGDTAVPLGGARLRALLTVLALRAGEAVATRVLIDEVWTAEEAPADSGGALQALVARLRRTLGRDAITSEPGGYRLNTPRESVDLYRFEALLRQGEAELRAGSPEAAAGTLGQALDMWRGPALADLPERPGAAARPEALRLTARRLWIEADLARGRAARALPALQEAVAGHPLDEAFRVQLIRALRAEGRSADALVAFEDARRVLAATLGTDPGPELRRLHAELLAGQPSDAGPPDPRPPLTSRTPETQQIQESQPPAKSAPTPHALRAVPAPASGPAGSLATRSRPGNLRARLTSFIGRETDLRDIAHDLATGRLVTLTGPGGSGKTRLAQEAAAATEAAGEPGADLRGRYPDGVWLAELAPLDDPAAIPHAVLSALGHRDTLVLGATGRHAITSEQYSEDPTARLLEYCATRRLLLVLDNCEHLIGPAAHLTAELLACCPGVTVLATSREPLGVPGEVVRPVEPLPPPTAHRLFAERAATARPPGSVPPGAGARPDGHAADDEAAVHEICRRLDGLPLAIELAAARLRALSPRQIADRLDDRFRLLTSGSRTVLPRQQTLRAVVDWSWDLLDASERATLRALSVFAGGCTLPAAEAVCGPDALGTVAQLVDKSLVVAEHGLPGGTRYRLLETIHEYAAERAAEHPDERAAAAGRHTSCYRDLVRATDPELRGADQLSRVEQLEGELDNVRAALHRAIEAGDEPDALAIALGMGWFWWLRNYRDEAAGWLLRVAELGGPPPADERHPMYWPRHDLRLLHFFVMSDHASEEQWEAQESQDTAKLLASVYRRGGPAAARLPGLLWPFTLYLLGGNAVLGEYVEEVVDNCRRYGGEWELAAALLFRTHVEIDSLGGIESAAAHGAELRVLSERLADRWIRAQVHSATAEIAAARGRYTEAAAELEVARRLSGELGATAEGPFLLSRMAELAYRSGDDGRAADLLARAEEEAERYAVWDARTYGRYLRAVLLLRRGEVAAARRMCELAVEHRADGTPPPLFEVLLFGLSARITAAQGDPAGALAELAVSVRTAVDVGCSESVVAAELDAAATMAMAAGDPGAAVTLSAAAEALRGVLPRSVPEREADEAVRRGAEVRLAPPELARARAAGARLDRSAAAALVAELAGRARAAAVDGGE